MLRVDMAALEALQSNLILMISTLEKAVDGYATCDAAGHDGLADAIASFSRAWELTRKSNMGSVEMLQKIMSSTIQGFKEVDASLANIAAAGGH